MEMCSISQSEDQEAFVDATLEGDAARRPPMATASYTTSGDTIDLVVRGRPPCLARGKCGVREFLVRQIRCLALSQLLILAASGSSPHDA